MAFHCSVGMKVQSCNGALYSVDLFKGHLDVRVRGPTHVHAGQIHRLDDSYRQLEGVFDGEGGADGGCGRG